MPHQARNKLNLPLQRLDNNRKMSEVKKHRTGTGRHFQGVLTAVVFRLFDLSTQINLVENLRELRVAGLRPLLLNCR
jgi:hypothetical protein